MTAFHMNHGKYIFLMFSIMACVSCNSVSNNKNELANILKPSFEKLYYAKYALEFPHTERALDNCKKYNNESFLRVYRSFKESKTALIRLSKENPAALDATLDIIEQSCTSKNENAATNICYGGLMSLYFYQAQEQDAKIFNRVKNYPEDIQNIIFNTEFFWFTNRPNPKQWTNYISGLTIDWRFSAQKPYVFDEFNKTIDQFEGEPWVLR